MNAGYKIRLMREAKGWNEAKLAAESNLRLATILEIEAATKPPSTAQQIRIAKALGVKSEDLQPMASPCLEALPQWQQLREMLHQHGEKYGWEDVGKYLVVMVNAWGREVARLKQMERRAG